jgi:demethylmenaquinone methyltransferase/2-methoxy-6-polyprenyl-1,4-benzoquinol methylase
LQQADLVEYYRRRAREYEAIYAKPERQADLAELRALIPDLLRGARVLEIACGTGYWTQLIAQAAASVLATDLAEEPMRIAQSKNYAGDIAFRTADAYALQGLGRFDAAFAGFWWSHVPRGRIEGFLASLHGCLESGARVVMLDNRYVPGSSTAIHSIDAEGNSYQLRRLGDGAEVRVLKNFPGEAELRARLSPHAAQFSYREFEYYWLVEYRLR